MADVVRFREEPDPMNENALGLVEETLARIKSGEVLAVAIVEVRKAGTVATAWTSGVRYHELNSGAARLAATLANEQASWHD